MNTAATLLEKQHTGAYLLSEAGGFQSRDTIVMSNAVESISGTVIAKAGVPAAETLTIVAL